jgi:glycosyltransferase involved in cell wall biosynthesis
VLIVVENEAARVDHRVAKQIDTLLECGYLVRVVTRRNARNREYRGLSHVCIFEYPPPPEPGHQLGYIVEYGYSFLAAALLLLRIAVRERIDVVQFCQPPDIYFPLAGVLRRLGTKVVVDQRDLLAELYTARYGKARPRLLMALRFFEKLSQSSADQIICVNDYLRKRALAVSGLPADRVSVVRNGPVLARIEEARGDESLKRGRRYLCCWVGVMGRQDRLDLLIRSIHHVVHELGRDDCQFTIIGSGESLAGTMALSRALNLNDWVHFTGALDPPDVFRYMATADVGLDASLQAEVSPVKAMEYMASGLPLVAFDLPETRAIAAGAAELAAPGDVQDHARTIDALLQDSQRRQELGRAGQLRVQQELAWDRQALTYVRVIERLCPVGRRPVRERSAGR